MNDKLKRMYEALERNSSMLANGGSKFYYTTQNERLSRLISAEENRLKTFKPNTMINITVEEIMDVIDSTSIEMYGSEWSELKLALEKLIESRKDAGNQITDVSVPIDEYIFKAWEDMFRG